MMVYALSLASLSMLVGTLFNCIPSKRRRWWLMGASGKWMAIWLALLQMPSFGLAAADYASDYASAMGIVLVLQIHSVVQTSSQAALWIIAGSLVSGLAIGTLSSGFTLSASFNHNDTLPSGATWRIRLIVPGRKASEQSINQVGSNPYFCLSFKPKTLVQSSVPGCLP